LALTNELLHVVGQATPRWSLRDVNVLDPILVVLMRLAVIWHTKDWLITTDSLLKQLEVQVVNLWSEELVSKRLNDLIVENVVNLAAEDRLRNQGS